MKPGIGVKIQSLGTVCYRVSETDSAIVNRRRSLLPSARKATCLLLISG